MPFRIIRDDLTRVSADAIVNTANPKPVYADGTDRAIYMAAGADELLAERKKIGKIGRGEAAVTKAFHLNARFIIHTVGPVWQGGDHGEFETLRSCYRKSLLLAEQLGCQSIAFPLISTGIYGFPREKALEIALNCFREHLEFSDIEITLVVFDRKSVALSSELVDDVEQFIDERYVAHQLEEEMTSGRISASAAAERREMNRRRREESSVYIPAEARDSEIESADAMLDSEIGSADDLLGSTTGSLAEDAEPSVDFTLYAPTANVPREASPKAGSRPSLKPGLKPIPKFGSGPSVKADSKPSTKADSEPSSKTDSETADVFQGKKPAKAPALRRGSLQDVIGNVGETFQQRLLRMIDERSYTDSEVYKKANIDRKLFSKIRCNADYNPSKKTVISLALALQLNLDETVDLLARAGFALSPSSKSDLIIEYCIEKEYYNVIDVNMLLFELGLPAL